MMEPDSRDDPLLDSLLDRWKQQVRAGGQPDLEALCQDHPHLVNELRRRVEQLGGVPDVASGPVISVSVPGPPPPEGVGEPAIIDRYEILEKLGEGGMGIVYKARHLDMGRIVALKVVRGLDVGTEDQRRRFRQEVRAASKLSHRNIVAALDAEVATGLPFLVMEFVEGEDLHKLVRQRGGLPVTEAVDCLIQAARGLGHAHEQGVVHRDVKPSNLLRAVDGTVKVLDLGLARLRASASGSTRPDDPTVTVHPTSPGAMMGTLAYMAPEQAADTASADHRADIYSLGCTLCFLLTGHAPYRAGDPVGLLLAHREGPIPSLRELRSDVPEGLDRLCQRMLAKRPADRPQSMAEVITSLGALELPDSKPPSDPALAPAIPTDPPTTTDLASTTLPNFQPGRRRGIGVLAWTAGLLVLVVVLGALGLWLRPRRPAPLPKAGQAAAGNPDPVGGSAGKEEGGRAAPSPVGLAVPDRWRPGADQPLFPGLIPRPARLPGIKQWQVETNTPRPRLVDAAVSPDHRWIACTFFPTPKLYIYDATTLRLHRVLYQERKGGASCFAWSPQGHRLAIGFSSGVLRLVDVDVDESESTAVDLKGHQGRISALAWSPDGKRLASAADDKTIRLWGSGETAEAVLTGHQGIVLTLAWSPDGRRLASVDPTGSVRLWRLDGKPITVLTGQPGPPPTLAWGGNGSLATSLAWRPDGQRLALCSPDNEVRIVDPDGQPGPILQGHEGNVLAVVWSPDGQRLASAGRDGTVRLWSADGGAGPVLKGHKADVIALAWNGPGSWIASYGVDRTVRLWKGDGTAGPVLNDVHTLDRGVPILDWTPNSERLLTIDDFHIRFWDPRGQAAGQLDCSSGGFNGLAWNPDGKTLVILSGGTHHDHGLSVWDSGASFASVIGDQQTVRRRGLKSASWKPDGRRLAVAGDARTISVLTEGGKLAIELNGHTSSIHQVSWSPDGKRLASAGKDGTIRLWESDGIPGPVLKGHDGAVNGIAWRPDGQRLASAGADRTIRLWDQDGRPGLILKGHEGSVRAVAWRPDGQRLASAGEDWTVRLWANDGVAGPVLRENHRVVSTVSWSPDGQWLASSVGNEVHIWYTDGVAGPVLPGHDEFIIAVAWSPPDGRRLAACSHSEVLYLWDPESGTLDRFAVAMRGPKSITFGGGGRVLAGDPALIERELVYFIEEEGGRRLTLKPSEFARRFPGALP
jgi:WD40 repeat protein/tRNA A-37 threonylcarbamoyl transferase component Bud32